MTGLTGETKREALSHHSRDSIMDFPVSAEHLWE